MISVRGVVVLLSVGVLTAAGSASAESRRMAIVVGNNAGNAGMTPLRYAESDAGKMARVLTELGDVGVDDVMLLQGRNVADLERAISDAHDRVAAFKKASPETRTVLIFYFSGHSDGEAIELGLEKLPYGRLKTMLLGTGADLRVAIVDACKSGAGFLQKGGKPAEAFSIKLTDTLVASGDAFITSSAADESALESSEVMGSFFTHNLISGLRGAADASGDKLVTLAEAYRYAFDRTVSATAMMPVGAQHPSYDYRLSGQGELVLSSLVKPSALIVLPEGADRSMITDLARDQVVVEVPGGPQREIAVAPGNYGLRLFKDGKSYGGRVTLPEGARKSVRWEELAALSSSVVVAAKGGPETSLTKDATSGPNLSDQFVFTATAGAVSGIADNIGLKGLLRIGFEPRRGPGLVFSLIGDTSFKSDFSEAGVQARVGFRWSWELGPVWLAAGAEVGPAFLWQVSSSGFTSSIAGAVAPRLGARLKIAGPLWLALDGDVTVMLLKLENSLGAVVLPSVTLGVALTF
jgi:hypothetical protein